MLVEDGVVVESSSVVSGPDVSGLGFSLVCVASVDSVVELATAV